MSDDSQRAIATTSSCAAAARPASAAAVGAARCGARVALLERAPFLGGAATLSGVLTYCGFWTQADPPQRAVAGVGGEVLAALDAARRRAAARRAPAAPGRDRDHRPRGRQAGARRDLRRGRRRRDPARLADRRAERGRGWCASASRATTAAPSRSRRRRSSTPAARPTWPSGPARRRATAARDGSVQNGTLAIRFGGIDPRADVSRAAWARAVKTAKADGEDEPDQGERPGRAARLRQRRGRLSGRRGLRRARRALASAPPSGAARRQAWAYLRAIRALPGHERAYIVQTGPAIGTRESRHVVARATAARRRRAGRAHPGRHGGAGRLAGRAPPRARASPTSGSGCATTAPTASRSTRCAAPATATCSPPAASSTPSVNAFASARVMGTAFATGHAAGVAAALHAGGGEVEVDSRSGRAASARTRSSTSRPPKEPRTRMTTRARFLGAAAAAPPRARSRPRSSPRAASRSRSASCPRRCSHRSSSRPRRAICARPASRPT